jgi:ribonuclease P protein component
MVEKCCPRDERKVGGSLPSVTRVKTAFGEQLPSLSGPYRRTLRRREILRGRKNFERIFRCGQKIEGRILRCLILVEPCVAEITCGSSVVCGVAVSRAIKRAVDRNRIKRMIREAYRCNKHLLLPQDDSKGSRVLSLVLVYGSRSPSRGRQSFPTSHEIRQDVAEILMTVARLYPRRVLS